MYNNFVVNPLIRKTITLVFLAIFAIGCIQAVWFIAKTGWFYPSLFLKNNGRYENIRAVQPGSDIALSAKQVLPPGSSVTISPDRDRMTRVALRYELYPIRIEKKSAYYLHLGRSAPAIPDHWQKRTLAQGAMLFASPGAHFLDQPPVRSKLPLSHLIAFVIGYCVLTCACGCLYLSGMGALWPEQNSSGLLSLSFLTGYLILTLAQWGYLMMGGVLRTGSIILVGAIVLLCGLLLHQKFGSTDLIQTLLSILKKSLRFQLLDIIFGLSAAAIFSAIVLLPVQDWDAMAHWLIKAKVLYAHQQPHLFYTHHNYYPLLWPMNIAAQYTLLGGIFDQAAKWTGGLFFLAILAQINAGMTVLKLSSPARKAVLIFFLLAFFNDPFIGWWSTNFTFANAENIFIAYTAGLAATLLLWMKTRKKSALTISVLMAAGMCAVKLEGIIIALFLIPCLLWIDRKESSSKGQPLFFLLALVIPLGWMLWSKTHGLWAGFYHFQDPVSMTKATLICSRFSQVMLNSKSILVVMFAVGLILLFGKKRTWSAEEKFLLLWAGVLLASIGVSFFGWPQAKIISDLRDVAARRFLHITPLLTLVWAGRMFASKD